MLYIASFPILFSILTKHQLENKIKIKSEYEKILKNENLTIDEKIELMKMPDREVSFLDAGDLNRILAQPLRDLKNEDGKNTEVKIKFRDKAILELLFSTGLRVSELTGIKRDNINLQTDEFSIRGKGSKIRVVFMSEQAKYWIKKYLAVRGDLNPYLFVSHDKRAGKNVTIKGRQMEAEEIPLTQRSVQRIVHKYARQAGITKPVTPHTLRHSYATDLLQNGADIRSVQAMLGHSSITTTQIYTHITDKELLNIHKKFHGKKRKE